VPSDVGFASAAGQRGRRQPQQPRGPEEHSTKRSKVDSHASWQPRGAIDQTAAANPHPARRMPANQHQATPSGRFPEAPAERFLVLFDTEEAMLASSEEGERSRPECSR
jgi:hypothetical protein